MVYDSKTRLNNLLTDKVAGKVIWTNYRQDEKS